MANFPKNSILIAPTLEHRPQHCDDEHAVFYDYPFRIGLKFPFPPLVSSILDVFNVSPGQLIPLAWRILWVLTKFTSNWQPDLTLAELSAFYELRLKELGRITLYKRSGADHLVDGLEVNGKGWKNGFFFVEKSSLGEAGKTLRGGWNVKDLRLDLLRSDTWNVELQDKLLAVPTELRSYSYYLGSSSLVVSTTHSFDSSMASDKGNKVLSREESKQILLKRKRGNTPSSSEVPPLKKVVQNVAGGISSTKGSSFVAPGDKAPHVLTYPSLTLPKHFLANKGLDNGIWPDAERLLFPTAKERLKAWDCSAILSQGIQHQLQLFRIAWLPVLI